jgi:hypothetical protein
MTPYIKIDEKGTLKATEHDKYENIAGSVWLSLFMISNGNAYYCPRRLAPGWAQLNIYINNFDPFQTMVCIWRWTWNLQYKVPRYPKRSRDEILAR